MSIERPTTETLDTDLPIEILRDCPSGKGARRFSMLAYTGAPVARSYGQFVIDLKGIELRSKIPMLLDHDGSKIAGYADKCLITDRGLELEGMLSSATEYGKVIQALSDEGFPWQASVGLEVLEREEVNAGETCEVNGNTLEGPVSIARKSRLPETSFLYSGADSATYAVALSSITTPKEATMATDPVAPVADTKEDLRAFRAEFPGQEELATQGFLDGKSVTDVKLELAAKDKEALAAANVQIETLTAELAKVTEELGLVKTLDKEAGEPGVGFSAQARESLQSAPKASLPTSPKEAWERSERLQAEFPQLSTYEALCRREGFNPQESV